MQALNTWHKTRLGHLVFGLTELGLGYILASLAIDSGNLWEWTAAFILVFCSAQNVVNMIRVHTK
jgi:hypothetical protein